MLTSLKILDLDCKLKSMNVTPPIDEGLGSWDFTLQADINKLLTDEQIKEIFAITHISKAGNVVCKSVTRDGEIYFIGNGKPSFYKE